MRDDNIQCTECGAEDAEATNFSAENVYRCPECGAYFEGDDFFDNDYYSPPKDKWWKEDE